MNPRLERPTASEPAETQTGLELLLAERMAFRVRVLRTAGALLAVLGAIFVVSEFGDQSAAHNAFLASLCAVGIATFVLTVQGYLRAATLALILGTVPAIGWIHIFGARAQMSVMYLVPLLVTAMVVSERRFATGLATASIAAAVVLRTLRWLSGVEGDFGAWLTPSFDAVMVLVTTSAMVHLGLRRTERNEAILRAALDDRERHAEAARRASDEKSSFLARVSHELRTPLNAILGYTELVREEEQLSSEADEDLDRVHDSAHQLLALIDSVLDLSKVEAGRLELHLREVPMERLLDTVRSTALPLVQRNGNQWVVEHEGPASAVLDESRVVQVLLNLVSNAARFTHEGTVTLRCHAEPGVVVFDVEDTGIGIEVERIGDLFQPFVQASADTTETFGGTGLGLALCDRFVRRMGGHINVRSEPGIGSTFRVVLPATLADQSGQESAETFDPGPPSLASEEPAKTA